MSLLPRTLLVLLPCAALLACGDDTSNATGGSATGGSAQGAGGAGAAASTGGGAVGGSSQGGSSTGGAGGAGGGSSACGGIAGMICDPGFYCDYPNDDCGAVDEQGLCTAIPTTCTDEVLPTCGCDGMVYGNPCETNAAGVDASTSGCIAPPATFACGSHFCGLPNEACFQTPNDVPEPPDTFYSCGALPAACSQNVPSCACAAELATSCGGTCEMSPEGGVVIHCPGG